MSLKIDSILIHGGIDGDVTTGAVNIPVYQTSTYKQDGLGETRGWEYSRTGNPTRDALERLIAELEHGKYGFAFASGLAAINTVLSLFKSGDKLVISDNIYGGTFRILENVFSNFGIAYEIVNTSDLQKVEDAIDEDVKAVFIESPANPLLTVTDIEAVAKITHEHGKILIVDNTFLTPYLQRPITLGAEGGVLAPWDSFLVIRGIKTLGVRMDRHVKNAERIARWLSESGHADRVYFPGLPEDPGYEIQKKQADGPGAIISFVLKDTYDYRKFFKNLKVITLAESLGGVESLVCHPATMTHAAIPENIRKEVGIVDELIRLSVGIEDVDDLIADLEGAIEASGKGVV